MLLSKISPEPDILLDPPELPEIPLPKGWSQYTLLTVLHVIAMARIIVLNVANWPDGGESSTLRLRCENDRLRGEVDMLKKELGIKDARFVRLDPKRRPHYQPSERLEILQLRAMRGWSTEQVAKRFHVTAQTIINWMNGVECGEDSTVAFAEKPNRYPDFVRYYRPAIQGVLTDARSAQNRRQRLGVASRSPPGPSGGRHLMSRFSLATVVYSRPGADCPSRLATTENRILACKPYLAGRLDRGAFDRRSLDALAAQCFDASPSVLLLCHGRH